MDWPLDNAELAVSPDLKKVFGYEPQPTPVLRLLVSEGKPSKCILDSQDDWEKWLKSENFPRPSSSGPGLCVVMSRRGHRYAVGGEQKEISHLSIPRDSFRNLAKKFYVHNSISKIICRKSNTAFTFAELNVGSEKLPALVYNCRTSSEWENDLALSVTHFPTYRFTYAIFYGCTTQTESQVWNRLTVAGAAAAYPLLLPGIFAELEHLRQVKYLAGEKAIEVEEKLAGLSGSSGGGGDNPLLRIQSSESTEETVDLWFETTQLRNSLQTWRANLVDMEAHAEVVLAKRFSSSRITSTANVDGLIGPDTRHNVSSIEVLRDVNWKAKVRLHSIIQEYDDKIRDCTMRVDGIEMVTKTWHAKASMDIALEMKRDGQKIGKLTTASILILPSMFIATLFSTEFFNGFPKPGEPMVSPHIWILASICGLATVLAVGVLIIIQAIKSCKGRKGRAPPGYCV